MRRQTPRSTLCPYTTLFRSEPRLSDGHWWHAAGPDANGSYLSATRETGQWFYSAESGVDAYTTVEPSDPDDPHTIDRKSTRLNSSHMSISYAVFCLKKKHPR